MTDESPFPSVPPSGSQQHEVCSPAASFFPPGRSRQFVPLFRLYWGVRRERQAGRGGATGLGRRGGKEGRSPERRRAQGRGKDNQGGEGRAQGGKASGQGGRDGKACPQRREGCQ